MRDVYVRARELLLEKGWCQGYRALNAEGEPVFAVAYNSSAVAFCLLGAMDRANYEIAQRGSKPYMGLRCLWPEVLEPVSKHIETLGNWSIGSSVIAQFNDTPGRTKEEVIAVLDAVIAEAV